MEAGFALVEPPVPGVFVLVSVPVVASAGGAFVMTLVTSVFFNALRPPVQAPTTVPAVVAAADPVPVLVAAAVVELPPAAGAVAPVDGDVPTLGWVCDCAGVESPTSWTEAVVVDETERLGCGWMVTVNLMPAIAEIRASL
jgi:hypothetical protein